VSWHPTARHETRFLRIPLRLRARVMVPRTSRHGMLPDDQECLEIWRLGGMDGKG
jgi:hypothetical protein